MAILFCDNSLQPTQPRPPLLLPLPGTGLALHTQPGWLNQDQICWFCCQFLTKGRPHKPCLLYGNTAAAGCRYLLTPHSSSMCAQLCLLPWLRGSIKALLLVLLLCWATEQPQKRDQGR